MKKILSLFMCSLLLLVSFTGCEQEELKVVECSEIVNTRYEAAHDKIETNMEYVFDPWKGELVYVPITKSVSYSEKYYVLYFYTYTDGTNGTEWVEVQNPYMMKIINKEEIKNV